MNERTTFTRMEDSTRDDWQAIGAEFASFSRGLPDRVIAHLKVLEGDYGGFPMVRRVFAQPRNSIYRAALATA